MRERVWQEVRIFHRGKREGYNRNIWRERPSLGMAKEGVMVEAGKIANVQPHEAAKTCEIALGGDGKWFVFNVVWASTNSGLAGRIVLLIPPWW